AINGEVAGLVVRVDSPGGSALASEEIRRAMERYRANDIPVAVSFANIAASGGYWVATGGDRIFAEPETVTGSIGVFAVLPTFENTAARFGVNADAIRTTPLSGQPDVIDGLTPEMDAIFQASISDTYSDFLTIVAENRAMSVEEVDRIAQGRVWDGGAARQVKLVDQFGGLDEALAWVAEKAELEDGQYHARFLADPVDGTDALIRQLLANALSPMVAEAQPQRAGDLFAMAAQNRDRTAARLVSDARRLGGTAGIQAYCLECPADAQPPQMAPSSLTSIELWRALMAE
ncbi:MAG: signal peptide peptidase SppA, partial [Pseudomonadota bacterium]